MDEAEDELMSYCRKCGGDRFHSVVAKKKARFWQDDDAHIDGGDRWEILECRGCREVTFVHSHWFSEDYDIKDGEYVSVVHRDLYPPSPSRKMPEWGMDKYFGIDVSDLWIWGLHEDVYAAIGLKAYSLAAMGIRAIVDFVVTSKAGDLGTFAEKLDRMREKSLITEIQVNVIKAAFDAGSAAIHRGHIPLPKDIFTLLDITENLLEQIYINPAQQARQAKAAAALKERTPQRMKAKNDT